MPAPVSITDTPKSNKLVLVGKRPPCFGSVLQRGTTLGYHPNLTKNAGAGVKFKLGPGFYNDCNIKVCLHKQKHTKQFWKRQTDSEEFSANMGFRNGHILAQRIFMSKHLGPGAHEIQESLFQKQSNSVCMNSGFGRQRRFFQQDDNLPPPGTHTIRKQKTKFSVRNTNWSVNDRFKDSSHTWNLAPNRYTYKEEGSLKALLEKVVSLRGPYDLFTGPRDEENIHNKFCQPKKCTPDKFYTYPTDIDYLFWHKQKSRNGVFFTASRFPKYPTSRLMLMDISTCYKDPDSPGPGKYQLPETGIRKLPEAKYAFGITGPEARTTRYDKLSPGPGRYEPKPLKCYLVRGGTSVFKSKTPRSQQTSTAYNSF